MTEEVDEARGRRERRGRGKKGSDLMAATIPRSHQLGHTLALLSEGVGGSGCKLLPKKPTKPNERNISFTC